LSLSVLFASFLFALHPTSADAAEFDYLSTDFWRKGYAIPMDYCRHDILIETPDLDTARAKLTRCPFETADIQESSAFTYCKTTRKDVEALIDSIKALGKIGFYRSKCPAIPDYPELFYKRDHLRTEAEPLHLSSSTLPGLAGLLDAQFQTLNRLISAHERASAPTVALLLMRRLPEQWSECASAIDKQLDSTPERGREQNRRFDGFNPWRRAPYPACDQLPKISAKYQVPRGSSKSPAIEKLIRSLGSPYEEPDCFSDRGRDKGKTFGVLSKRPSAEISKRMLRIDGLISWARVGQLRHAKAVLDDQRVEILTRELQEAAPLLEKAPHVRALAQAEIERVRPTAEKMRAIRSATLVLVTIVEE